MTESRLDQVSRRHQGGYNCAQAVLCSYSDLFGLDEDASFRVAEGLGLGMGGMEGTCGALTGACMLAGLKGSTANLEAPDSKGSTYRISRELVAEFARRVGATQCAEIKGRGTGKVLCSCPDCVRVAATLVEEQLL